MYSVSAQDAGDELERIYDKRGKIDPADVVDESRPDDAVLHPCFEWRDDVAAEEWRKQQARTICRCIVTVAAQEGKDPVAVRAVMHVHGSYHPTQIIVQDQDKYNDLLQSALREFTASKKKFSMLSNFDEIRAIFDAIDAAVLSQK